MKSPYTEINNLFSDKTALVLLEEVSKIPKVELLDASNRILSDFLETHSVLEHIGDAEVGDLLNAVYGVSIYELTEALKSRIKKEVQESEEFLRLEKEISDLEE